MASPLSSPLPPQADHPAHQLRVKLEKCMYRRDEKSKRFITSERIENFWPGKPDDLRDLLCLQKDDWTDSDLDILQRDFKRIICILAWVRDNEFHHHLRRLLQLRSKEQNESSSVIPLPLSVSDCAELFGEATGQEFFKDQFIFDAIIISSDPENIQMELPERRWPFTSDPTPIGAGGFGEVAKVRIVKRHLRHGHMSLHRDHDVAIKQFQEEKAWLKEVGSLEVLKGSLSSHDHLVLHLAAIIRGPELSIFLPYTQYGDLETYFQEGYLARDTSTAPSRESYNFSASFPKACLKDMLREFAKITDAIDFLHTRLSSKTGSRVFCAHVDLRPQNILVFPPDDDNHPAGFFKISDFGISSFRLEDGKSVPEPARGEHPSIGDVVEKRWSRSGTPSTTLPALSGAHRAPEASLEHYPYGPRASDLWSLACILSELIVFGTGFEDIPKDRRNRLNEFRKQREKFQVDLLRTNDSFFDRNCDDTPNGKLLTISVRAKVNEWLLERVIGDGQQWQGIVSITRQMLHPNPSERVHASEICKQILQYCEDGQASQATMIPSGEEPIWRVYVDKVEGQNYKFLRPFEGNSIEQSTSKPVERQGTTQSIGSMEVSRPENAYPNSLRVTRTRFHESSDKKSDIVESAPSGKMAAYLTPLSKSYPCQIKFRSALDLNTQSDESSIKVGRTILLPDDVDWTQISLGENRAVVRGTSLSKTVKGQTAVCVVDLQTKTHRSLPVERNRMTSLTHVCASGGVIAAGSDESVCLWTFDGEPIECPSLPKTSVALVDISMSDDAQFVFCWWTDFVEVWNIADTTRPQLAGKVRIKKASVRPETRFIIPCGSLPACIIYDSCGTVATVVVSDADDKSCKVMTQPGGMKLGLPRSAALCATSNHLLSYVNSHGELFIHRLSLVGEDSLVIENEVLLRYSPDINDIQCISLGKLDDDSKGYSLKMYNGRGEVLDLTLGVT